MLVAYNVSAKENADKKASQQVRIILWQSFDLLNYMIVFFYHHLIVKQMQC